ncbi:iron uptake porin [Gloeocapsa sp. PCC 73106]|uniref:iron uptake porin n=1 Tax=Gloeocapsa sp. PCC 73106 TaxID=102232 RepID=UPI0002AC4B91|nr:iron uptake porin [Gloeocapsa sp. PCC 73106]ELR97047.1 putative S-layer protein [Gloeocapsa sp. PCC 73106]
MPYQLADRVKGLLVVLTSLFLVSENVLAQTVEKSNSIPPVINVSDLRDVSPGDWAYEALTNLVERYGCIVGYPDQTFRGDRSLSRYEFAAGLNACLEQIERLVEASAAITREDLETLNRLSREFEPELAALGARVDNLEGRVSFLEDHQFSTTTKLQGELITTLSQVFGNENAATGEDLDVQAAINYRLRLNFLTSFNGRDRLRVRLESSNFSFGRGGTNYTDYNFSANSDNQVRVRKAEYIFPVGQKTTITVSAINMLLDDIADPIAPFAGPTADGAISYFGAIAPIYLNSSGGGLAVTHYFTDAISIVGYYSAGNANNPTEGNGLFNGQYVAAVQLSYIPTANTGVGIVYNRSYFPGGDDIAILGFSGSALAENPFEGSATSSDNVAIVGSWLISEFFGIEGWGMYTKARGESGDRNGDTADIWNWKLSFAFPDLFREGNLGLLSVGSPPKAYSVTGGPEDSDVPFLVELLYVFRVNDNISITPGVFVVTNPEDGRDPLWVGTIRTSFDF